MSRTFLTVLATTLLAAPLFASTAAAQEVFVFTPPPPSMLPLPPPPSAAELPPPEWMDPPQPAKPKKRRGLVIAVDLGAAVPFKIAQAKSVGVGMDVRLGYRFAAGPFFFSPEGTMGYVEFPKWDGALRFGGGARLGLHTGIVEPSIYGYGGGFWNIWKVGWGVRTGAALDLRPYRFLVPGVHADYNIAGWDTKGRVEYVSMGAHLGFVL